MLLQHPLGFGQLRIYAVIAGCQDHRVAVFLRDHIDAVGADGKEGIGQGRDDEADRFRLESAKSARHLIGAIVEFFDGSVNPFCSSFTDVGGIVQNARDGHGPDFGKLRDVDHSGFVFHFYRAHRRLKSKQEPAFE